MGRKLPEAAFDDLPWAGDPWRLIADRTAMGAPQASAVLATGNGFIGVRGPGGAPGEPKVYLNGVFETMPIAYHEAAHGYAKTSDTRLPVADASRITITIDGAPIPAWDRVTLDMAAGMLIAEVAFDGIVVRAQRLITMGANVIATRVTVTSPSAITVSVAPIVTSPPAPHGSSDDAPYDPRVGPAFAASPWTETATFGGEWPGRADRLQRSGFTVAAVAGPVSGAHEVTGTAQFDRFAAYHAERDADDPLKTARQSATDAAARGFDALAADQADWFAAYWHDAHIAFPDCPAAEQALRHALFQLVQAVGHDGRTSIAAKGQTGEGYEGHVFWDADSYVLPALVHFRPDMARAMLVWRIAGLNAARANARAMGQARGALYPWRTIGGGECSSFFPAGSAQYHINADIAHALRLYVAVTGDETILADGGAEMLIETARIWLEIGFHDPARGAFVINRVTGPDEYSAIVDNNLYTNIMAAEHLAFAATMADDFPALIDPDEAKHMKCASETMAIPFDAARAIPAQDDRFFAHQPWPFAETPADRYPLLIHHHPLTLYRHQVSKQADAVLASVVQRDRFDRATRARMLEAYEAVTVHDSTLSASAFASAAAGIGDAARAWHYWRVSALTDLGNLFANSDHGLHMASLAGSWTALAMGFAGMRSDDGLSFAPIAVPGFGRYEFRVRYRDRSILIAVGTDVRYTLESGAGLDFRHGDEELRLEPGQSVARTL